MALACKLSYYNCLQENLVLPLRNTHEDAAQVTWFTIGLTSLSASTYSAYTNGWGCVFWHHGCNYLIGGLKKAIAHIGRVSVPA